MPIRNTRYFFLLSLLAAFSLLLAERTVAAVVYYHPDHLGSASVLTDSEGTVAGETQYYPYGETFHSTTDSSSGYLYTDQEKDGETDLYYYGARYYDPILASFLSVDPIIASAYLPSTLNPYSPMLNNPVRLVDPDGRTSKESQLLWGKQRLNKLDMELIGNEIKYLQSYRQSLQDQLSLLDKLGKAPDVSDKIISLEKIKNINLGKHAKENRIAELKREIAQTSFDLDIMQEHYEKMDFEHKKLTKTAMKKSSPSMKRIGRAGAVVTVISVLASKETSATDKIIDLTLSGISFAAGPFGVLSDLLFFPDQMGDSTLSPDFDPGWKCEPNEGPNSGTLQLDLGTDDQYLPMYEGE